MCTHSSRNPFHCIVPPYMVKRLEAAGDAKRSLFATTVNTRFNDELFRKKRSLLTEMTGRQMKSVLVGAFSSLVPALAPTAKSAAVTKGAKKKPAPVRKIYDSQNNGDQKSLPGKLVRKEGQKASADKDVNNIYDSCGHTWDFYYSQFNRNSIDGNGLPMINSVHFGNKFGNAFWEGTQMVYGDGDAIFKSFTLDIDITGHELSHGVVQYEANLEYAGQSGAINESMADVFGVMVRQLALNETSGKGRWLIGRNCMRGTGYALRSLEAPGTAYQNHPILGDDPQPAHMNNYMNLPNTRDGDYGGVHINSGIPNHAFYLAATEIGGAPWLKAGKIWYQALCDELLLNSNSQFADLANATIVKAGALFGAGSKEENAVKKAWKDVGL